MQTETITCQTLMMDFAADTGLLGTLVTPRRYLWTDAFAVCNFLELYRQTDDQTFLQLAIQLVDQVHHILGRHRSDSVHQGWLSGRAEEDGQQHPTIAGLRIGKELHERLPGEAPDEALEWQQDGQYFHYLTQWMHALNCLATTTRRALYLQWAQELAKAVHAAFVYSPGNGAVKRMYWKMSVDLSRPLVQSMGLHDALDGLVTYLQLEAAAQYFPNNPNLPGLKNEIQDMRAMCAGNHWAPWMHLVLGGWQLLPTGSFNWKQAIIILQPRRRANCWRISLSACRLINNKIGCTWPQSFASHSGSWVWLLVSMLLQKFRDTRQSRITR
jgi:hypothetical protein